MKKEYNFNKGDTKLMSFNSQIIKWVDWRKLLIAPLFIAILLISNNIYSQETIDPETTVLVDFGVDGDAFVDILSYWPTPPPNPPNQVGTDDWVDEQPDGDTSTGAGVIDIFSPFALGEIGKIENGENVGIELRMSAFPYSVPDDNGIWIDAAYVRDQNVAGGNKDMTVFEQKINKNFDDPRSWSFKNGDVPSKTDIIDVFGHLRRVDDPPLDDDEYAYMAASTADADGSNHLDFEYFRKRVDFVNNQIVYEDPNEGGDCGHTTYAFDTTAVEAKDFVVTHGDVLLSVDYKDGGKTAEITILAWIDKRDFPTDAHLIAFNNEEFRPFEFIIANDAFTKVLPIY